MSRDTTVVCTTSRLFGCVNNRSCPDSRVKPHVLSYIPVGRRGTTQFDLEFLLLPHRSFPRLLTLAESPDNRIPCLVLTVNCCIYSFPPDTSDCSKRALTFALYKHGHAGNHTSDSSSAHLIEYADDDFANDTH